MTDNTPRPSAPAKGIEPRGCPIPGACACVPHAGDASTPAPSEALAEAREYIAKASFRRSNGELYPEAQEILSVIDKALAGTAPSEGDAVEQIAVALFNEAHADSKCFPPAKWETGAFEESRKYYRRLARAVAALCHPSADGWQPITTAPPLGATFEVEHDGFVGTVQGYYVTREGKEGVNLQQAGTRVVHVYGRRWLKPLPPPSPSPPTPKET